MSFSNLIFDINTPSFTATNNSNNMSYNNLSSEDSGIETCTTNCAFINEDPVCIPTFENKCTNNNEILSLINGPNYVGKDDSNCVPVGDRITYQFTYSAEQKQYCGTVNDKQMCQIGTYGTGGIDGPSAVKGVDWGLVNNPTGINSGWINCVYLYDFEGSLNNQNYIGFRNWLKSILTINTN
jgi:hypothetical protein